jgi:hypothetical protein
MFVTKGDGRVKRFVLVCGCLLFALFTGAARADVNVTDVTPADMQGWAFIDDNTGLAGTGTMVAGPGVPPLGTGSAQVSVGGPADRQLLGTAAFTGTPLSAITLLDYWSYQTGPILALSLQFDIRYRPTDTAYGGRLVFEPYQQTGVVPSGWTHSSAVAGPTGGRWWSSKITPAGSDGLCPQSSPCTWAQIRANWPDAAISGALFFKAGGGWSAFTGNVDAFTIGIGTDLTVFNFDPSESDQDQGDAGVDLQDEE